jgi:hypothetical protein
MVCILAVTSNITRIHDPFPSGILQNLQYTTARQPGAAAGTRSIFPYKLAVHDRKVGLERPNCLILPRASRIGRPR